MIDKFKMFEYVSRKEEVLNQLLDKINKGGKESLSKVELTFLNQYPDGNLENDISNNDIPNNDKIFDDLFFTFTLKDIDKETISNDFIISGDMYFKKVGILVSGYFIINLTTNQIFPYFNNVNGETAYDHAHGDEDSFHAFLELIYFDLTKNN